MRISTLIVGLLAGTLWVLLPEPALACPSCYGAITDTEIARGLQFAMLVLIGTTAMIGTGVVMFFSNIKKRAGQFENGELDLPSDS